MRPSWLNSTVYGVAGALVLGMLILIATVFKANPFIRGFVGDALIVVWIYLLVRIRFQGPSWRLASGVFLFSCAVECVQYFRLLSKFGLERNISAQIVAGNTFDLWDFAAYFGGTFFIFLLDSTWRSEREGVL